MDHSFRFVDKQGNEVHDGAVVNVTDVSLDDWGEEFMEVPLLLEKTAEGEFAVALYENIDDMPNGSWTTCALGNCIPLSATGYSSKSIVDGDYIDVITTEWLPADGDKPVWEATLQIHVLNIVEESKWGVVTRRPGDEVIGYGPKVTIRFAYGEEEAPTGIQEAVVDMVKPRHTQTSAAWFDVAGRRLTEKQSGSLMIVKLPDGRVRKVI